MELDDPRSSTRPPLARTAVDPDESVVVTVVRAVAAVADVSVTSLPPLGNTLDPEALEALTSASTFSGTVTFEYDGYVVHVEAGETVAIYEASPDA